MKQILEFRDEKKCCILKVILNMNDIDYMNKKIQVYMLAEDLKTKEVCITIKDDNEKCYFIGTCKL